MSACSASDRRIAALVATAVLLCAGAVSAADSTRTRGRVSVGPSGVHVVDPSGRSRVSVGPGGVHVVDSAETDGDVRVSVGPGGVSVSRAGSGDPSVEIAGDHGLVVVNDGDAGLVRVFADADVDAGERIEGDVVAVFGSVRVRGEVTGNVVAVGGSVRVDPGASIEGDAVAVGGVLDQAEGATVGGESVSVGFLPIGFGIPAVPIVLATVLSGWALTVFAAWLLGLVFGDRMARVARTASRRTALSFLLGLVSFPFMLMSAVLLLVTVIGIPVAFLLPVAYAVLAWSGQIAATSVLGSKLLRRRVGEGSFLASVVAGSLLVAAFFVAGVLFSSPPGVIRTVALFFSLFGGLLVFGLTTIGSGAVLLSRFGSRDPAAHGQDLAGASTAGPAPTVGAAWTSPPAGV